MQAAEALEPGLARTFGNWIEQASRVLGERHRVIHSLWILRANASGIAEYSARHPRTALEMDANPDSLRNIATRLDECSDYGFELIFTNGPQLKPRKDKSEHA
jgi:hypothetical protein